MSFAMPSILSKENVTLRVLDKSHENLLTILAAEEQIWEHAPEKYYEPAIFKEKWFNKAMKQIVLKERICFSIVSNDKIVGSSSYYEIDYSNKKMNIGYTWFHPSVWGTNINA